MIRHSLVVLASVLCAGTALAADLGPAPSAPLTIGLGAKPTVMDWSGLHFGVQGGWARSNTQMQRDWQAAFADLGVANPDPTGFTGGVRGGYDIQFGNGIVAGVLAEANLASLEKDTAATVGGVTSAIDVKVDSHGLAGVRLGYAFNDVLVYGLAGGALANMEVATSVGPFSVRDDQTLAGYALGAGVDYAISPNMIAGLGYRFMDLGSERYYGGVDGFDTRIGAELHTVQGSISFKW